MKTHLLDEHIQFFARHHSIEIEGLFTAKDLAILDQGLTLLRSPSRSLPAELRVRHDLWRTVAPFKKIAFHRGLAEAVHCLEETRPLRIGYDLYLSPATASNPITQPHHALFQESASLQSISSLRSVVCGALIALKDSDDDEQTSFFPRKKGHVLFIDPDLEIPWPRLRTDQKNDYYLIVYVGAKAVYARNSRDPFSGAFIQYGYSNGDRLSDAKNPVIY